MTWVCPSCATAWPEKPLVDGTVGCPECGSIGATVSAPLTFDNHDQRSGANLARLTEVVRRADRTFEVDGGGTRHWIREHFVPELEAAGLAIVESPRAPGAEALIEALQAYETAMDRHDLWCGYRAEAPGDGSLNHAQGLARAALDEAMP